MDIASRLRIDNVRLRPDEQVPAHTDSTWELSYVITGRGTRRIGATEAPFGPGDVVLVPPGMPHVWRFDPARTEPDGTIANITLCFPPRLVSDLAAALPDLAGPLGVLGARAEAVSFTGETGAALRGLLGSLVAADTPHDKAVIFLKTAMLLGTCGSDGKSAGKPIPRSRAAARADKVRIYCLCNHKRPVRLADAAAHAGMSVAAFCKFFHRHFGRTFSEHINHLRVDACCRQLAATTDPVAAIAYDNGFTSVPYFNRVFQRLRGETPTAYRRAARG